MDSIILLYNRFPFDPSDDNRYYKSFDFSGIVGDFCVPGFSLYAICSPHTFELLRSVPERSFLPIDVE